jgi:hypothetical protein
MSKSEVTFEQVLQLTLANAEAIEKVKTVVDKQAESLERLERLVYMHEKDRLVMWEGMEVLSKEMDRKFQAELAEIKALRRDQSKLIEQLVYKKILE